MTDAEWKTWLESRPPKVREVAERIGRYCLRSTENRGHYEVYSIDVMTDGTITVKIVHGRDSYLPGVMAVGIPPETLVPCGCGKWEIATDEQIDETERKLAAMKAAGAFNKKERGH